MSDSSHSASGSSPSRLKRSFAQQANASLAHQAVASEYSAQAKHPKLEDVLPSSSVFCQKDAEPTRATLKMPLSGSPVTRPPKSASVRPPRSAAPSRVPPRAKSKLGPSTATPNAPVLESPLHDRVFIIHEHTTKSRNLPPIKPAYEDNPKSPLSNFFTIVLGRVPEYQSVLGVYPDKHEKIWRTTVTVETEVAIIGIGDSPIKKESEKLAALSAVYQLHEARLLDVPKSKSEPSPFTEVATTAKLSDGTEVTQAVARQFMDYYCRRFQFGKPDITFEEIRGGRGSSTWEAVMTVGGRRIGLGAGPTKKAAQITCYLDVTHYLESRDRQLWETFVEAAKTGKDLGMAPKVHFDISDGLSDEIRDLCHEMRRSTLYSHRQNSKWVRTGEEKRQVHDDLKPSDFRGQVSSAFLAEKSKRLLKMHQTYLEDPKFQTMRDTRASLPVYTRSDDIIAYIHENDVTILMASTGSGKTTQVPQLILEHYIRQGEGANCNILCTQPRRIAAISVADRVAKERGEFVGRGTVGYQVRFDSNPPEDHGSITYCTTGVFLKRMQSALSSDDHNMGTKGLANVTHVVVDEVHERDVDTDLLLVVLKRFMASRKAMKNPIKVILMSATIDPTLFQNYFPDDGGRPARVLDIPGRSFPVTKYFLEDFIVDLLSSSQTRWPITQDSVIKYLRRELEPTIAFQLGLHHGITYNSGLGFDMEEELELPYPLIALTIAYVLQKTDLGHVLVFLPGWDEIINVQNALLNPLGPLGLDFKDTQKYNIHLLHSTIPLIEQQEVFEPPPPGVRRIILATNIAETSITIPNVVYVIDTAKIKEQRYDPHRRMSSIVSAWVGSSNLSQRAGRAGRHRSGEYFGILGQKRANELHPHQTVEMKRVDLSNVVMHVKALNFPGVTVEEVLGATIEPPGAGRVEAAMKDLQMVGAVDERKRLTSLGRVLLQLPVDVQMGRLVLFGSFFRCLDQALTLAAILTNREPFVSPIHLKTEAAHKKNSWTSRDFRSDALATLQAYNAWWALQSKGQYQNANRFCTDNFLSKPTLLLIQKIKGHLLQSLYHAGVIDVSAGGSSVEDDSRRSQRLESVPPELNTNGYSLPLLAALIAIASQPKFAIRTGERIYRTVQDKVVFVHPSSVNNRKREPREQDEPLHERELYAYAEKRQNTSVAGGGTVQTYLITTTRLDPMTYMLFGAYRLEVAERGLECDGWLPIQGNLDALDDIQRLKSLLEACMLRVFDGISVSKQRNIHQRSLLREEDESEDDDDKGARSMSPTEIKELDKFTCAVVNILNRYREDRMASQSRQSSRPATPMGSPSLSSVRLPGSPFSGYSSPYNVGSAYNSRPGTPSRLSRRC